jgi:GH35 family endo-1,4-beta-xylanase
MQVDFHWLYWHCEEPEAMRQSRRAVKNQAAEHIHSTPISFASLRMTPPSLSPSGFQLALE